MTGRAAAERNTAMRRAIDIRDPPRTSPRARCPPDGDRRVRPGTADGLDASRGRTRLRAFAFIAGRRSTVFALGFCDFFWNGDGHFPPALPHPQSARDRDRAASLSGGVPGAGTAMPAGGRPSRAPDREGSGVARRAGARASASDGRAAQCRIGQARAQVSAAPDYANPCPAQPQAASSQWRARRAEPPRCP
jgi:hypothetical protein